MHNIKQDKTKTGKLQQAPQIKGAHSFTFDFCYACCWCCNTRDRCHPIHQLAERMVFIMLTAAADNKTVTIDDLMGTPLGDCIVPGNYGFRLLLDADADPADPLQMVGGGEMFRVPSQGLVLVGERGTIVSASIPARSKSSPTIVAKQTNGDGYHVISDHYGCETCRVCRLVASVWVPGRDPAAGVDEVDHLDGVRTNDSAANLEWVDHATNIRRSYLRPGRRPRRKWTPDDVVLLVPRRQGGPETNYGQPLLVYADAVAAITRSSNVSHCLTYGDRAGCGEYFVWPVPSAWVHPDDYGPMAFNGAKIRTWMYLDDVDKASGIKWMKDMAMWLLEDFRPLHLRDMHIADGYYYYASFVVGGGAA